MPKKHFKLCAYCGRITTDWDMDHPVPQCLWDGTPLPNRMVTVRCCGRCNRYWSLHDGYFRSIMAMWAKDGSHPLLEQMIKGSIKNHVSKDNALSNDIFGSLQMVPMTTATGLYVGDQPSFRFNRQRVDAIFGKIARGLFFHIHGKPVPATYHVTVRCDPRMTYEIDTQSLLAQLKPEFNTFGEGDSVFVGKRAYQPDKPDMNMFYFVIYKSIQALVFIAPPQPNDPFDTSSPEFVEVDLRNRDARKQRYKNAQQ